MSLCTYMCMCVCQYKPTNDAIQYTHAVNGPVYIDSHIQVSLYTIVSLGTDVQCIHVL